ncbi:MAG TPA: MFS transporter [Burkholderiaceae bacterium]|nr:MFS transporter [Burkholderiaceae bacterium]
MSAPARAAMPAEHRQVIVASSIGALFEWYDFYLFGVLAPVFAQAFFAGAGEHAALATALLAFAAGFLVRPVGALLFGRLGDLIGRKYTFLVTLVLMGGATFVIGLLPSYDTIGAVAPALLVLLRLLQGLAIGGEYGGVATYVAEHAPRDRRGLYTGWVQTTASLGLLLALVASVGLRSVLGDEAFAAWGWRLPFLASLVLLVVGIWVRLRLRESPLYVELKRSGGASRRPLTEAFGHWRNLRQVLIALFGLVAAQAVVWYTGQFEALFFLTITLKVPETSAALLLGVALLLASPLFVLFGAWSDRIGRKPIILTGCVLAAASWLPLFGALAESANPALVAAQQRAAVQLHAAPQDCAWRVVARDTACAKVQRFLQQRSVHHGRVDAHGPTTVTIAGTPIEIEGDEALWRQRIDAALDAAGYPRHADPARIAHAKVVAILFVLVAFVAMVYGPLAATLVEMFPTRVRCSSVSLPYHLGNGWFGGLVPSTVLAVSAHSGSVADGLWVPIGVTLASVAIGLVFLRESRGAPL